MRPLIQPTNAIGVMGHVIADYPSAKVARELIDAMVASEVRLIEIQIPFSEPMADGPIFMAANHEAVADGIGFEQAIALMQQVSQQYQQMPFVFMTYANIIYNEGYVEFVIKAKQSGARGAIVPDLPPEMAEAYLDACRVHEFANIVVIPPNVDDERLAQLCQAASGMVYVVARAGVTGSKTDFGDDLDRLLHRVRQHTDLPLAVGFGIQDRAGVQALNRRADLAVIGSEGLRVFQSKGLEGAKAFWRSVTS